jgi:F-type H+-transporting ATPase subunit gamma
MASLKEVRNRIVSVQSTQQITKAMKMVAAAKLRRAQDNILRMRPYAQRLNSILSNLTAQVGEEMESDYTAQREVRRVLIIAITSDRGLAGAFNSNIFKGVNALIAQRYAAQAAAGTITVLAIGKRAHEYFSKRGPILGNYTHVFGQLSFDTVRVAAEQAMEGFRTGQYDEVTMVYNEFKNVATQVVRAEQLLPLIPAETSATTSATSNVDYIFEPSKEDIVQTLIPQSLKVQLYKA